MTFALLQSRTRAHLASLPDGAARPAMQVELQEARTELERVSNQSAFQEALPAPTTKGNRVPWKAEGKWRRHLLVARSCARPSSYSSTAPGFHRRGLGEQVLAAAARALAGYIDTTVQIPTQRMIEEDTDGELEVFRDVRRPPGLLRRAPQPLPRWRLVVRTHFTYEKNSPYHPTPGLQTHPKCSEHRSVRSGAETLHRPRSCRGMREA